LSAPPSGAQERRTGSSLTVEGWVLYRGATAADGEFITAFNYGCTSEEQSVVFVNDGFISVETRDADRNLSEAVASTPFPLNAFHHFAATRSMTAGGASLRGIFRAGAAGKCR
jgi:hypothetical protein